MLTGDEGRVFHEIEYITCKGPEVEESLSSRNSEMACAAGS